MTAYIIQFALSATIAAGTILWIGYHAWMGHIGTPGQWTVSALFLFIAICHALSQWRELKSEWKDRNSTRL